LTSPQFDPKRTTEDVKLTFDFVNLLASGETISTASTTAIVHKGTDASPSAIISGAAAISGTRVTQLVIDGTDGVTYCLICQITTSAGQTLDGVGTLKVSDDC
jgi:hypothetical protein